LLGLAVGLTSLALLNIAEREGEAWVQEEIGGLAEKIVNIWNQQVQMIEEWFEKEILYTINDKIEDMNFYVDIGNKTVFKITTTFEKETVEKTISLSSIANSSSFIREVYKMHFYTTFQNR